MFIGFVGVDREDRDNEGRDDNVRIHAVPEGLEAVLKGRNLACRLSLARLEDDFGEPTGSVPRLRFCEKFFP